VIFVLPNETGARKRRKTGNRYERHSLKELLPTRSGPAPVASANCNGSDREKHETGHKDAQQFREKCIYANHE
jgi:hypothetical protein